MRGTDVINRRDSGRDREGEPGEVAAVLRVCIPTSRRQSAEPSAELAPHDPGGVFAVSTVSLATLVGSPATSPRPARGATMTSRRVIPFDPSVGAEVRRLRPRVL